jgi:exopolyphosphatase/guanosine-5'-triphosphate,3'-diphosphate pyrophosphatase
MLRQAVLDFARSHGFEEAHALQDERLALRLFDETARLGLHALAVNVSVATGRATARELLASAAILHDIGYSEGYEEHHKTAFRLISTAFIPSLHDRDRLLVAHVARYHRGATPDTSKHAALAALSRSERDVVTQLGAILRFADGLDRSHANAVADLACSLEGERFSVVLSPGRNDAEERWAGQKKARWFASVFQVEVDIR